MAVQNKYKSSSGITSFDTSPPSYLDFSVFSPPTSNSKLYSSIMTVISKFFALCAITTSFTASAAPMPDGTVPNIAAAPSPSKIIVLGERQYNPPSPGSFPSYPGFPDYPGTPRDDPSLGEAFNNAGFPSAPQDESSFPSHPSFSEGKGNFAGSPGSARTVAPSGETFHHGGLSSLPEHDGSLPSHSNHGGFSGPPEHDSSLPSHSGFPEGKADSPHHHGSMRDIPSSGETDNNSDLPAHPDFSGDLPEHHGNLGGSSVAPATSGQVV